MQLRDKTNPPGRYREVPDTDCLPLEVAKFAHEHCFDPTLPPACFPTLKRGEYRSRLPEKIPSSANMIEELFADSPQLTAREVEIGMERRFRHFLQSIRLDDNQAIARRSLPDGNGGVMERLFLKEHVRQMDWAKLNNGLKFLIYRTIFINQPNNEAVFELLQLEEGDLNHFYDIFNNEERIHLAFEAAHEAYRVAMRGGPKKMSSSSRQKNGSMLHSQEAYEDRLTELHTEIDNLNRSRKVGFRKAVVALEDEIRELESEQLELDSVASPSRTSSPEVETDKDYGYKDPKKLTAAHLRNLDKLPRPTEYCLSVRDVQDGFRYLQYHGYNRWHRDIVKSVALVMITYKGVRFTWNDLDFVTIYDCAPESDVEEGEREHEPVYYLAALPVMQSIEQAQHAIELRPSPGSAEQAIAQQVRRQVVLADDKRVHTPSKLPQPDFKRPGRIPDVILMVSAPKRSNPNSAEDDAVKKRSSRSRMAMGSSLRSMRKAYSGSISWSKRSLGRNPFKNITATNADNVDKFSSSLHTIRDLANIIDLCPPPVQEVGEFGGSYDGAARDLSKQTGSKLKFTSTPNADLPPKGSQTPIHSSEMLNFTDASQDGPSPYNASGLSAPPRRFSFIDNPHPLRTPPKPHHKRDESTSSDNSNLTIILKLPPEKLRVFANLSQAASAERKIVRLSISPERLSKIATSGATPHKESNSMSHIISGDISMIEEWNRLNSPPGSLEREGEDVGGEVSQEGDVVGNACTNGISDVQFGQEASNVSNVVPGDDIRPLEASASEFVPQQTPSLTTPNSVTTSRSLPVAGHLNREQKDAMIRLMWELYTRARHNDQGTLLPAARLYSEKLDYLQFPGAHPDIPVPARTRYKVYSEKTLFGHANVPEFVAGTYYHGPNGAVFWDCGSPPQYPPEVLRTTKAVYNQIVPAVLKKLGQRMKIEQPHLEQFPVLPEFVEPLKAEILRQVHLIWNGVGTPSNLISDPDPQNTGGKMMKLVALLISMWTSSMVPNWEDNDKQGFDKVKEFIRNNPHGYGESRSTMEEIQIQRELVKELNLNGKLNWQADVSRKDHPWLDNFPTEFVGTDILDNEKHPFFDTNIIIGENKMWEWEKWENMFGVTWNSNTTGTPAPSQSAVEHQAKLDASLSVPVESVQNQPGQSAPEQQLSQNNNPAAASVQTSATVATSTPSQTFDNQALKAGAASSPPVAAVARRALQSPPSMQDASGMTMSQTTSSTLQIPSTSTNSLAYQSVDELLLGLSAGIQSSPNPTASQRPVQRQATQQPPNILKVGNLTTQNLNIAAASPQNTNGQVIDLTEGSSPTIIPRSSPLVIPKQKWPRGIDPTKPLPHGMKFINGQLLFTPEAFHLAQPDSSPRPQNQNKTLYQEFIPQTKSFTTAGEQGQSTAVDVQASLHPEINASQALEDQIDANFQMLQTSQVQNPRFNGMAVNNVAMSPAALAPGNSFDHNMVQRGAGHSINASGSGNESRPRSMSMGTTVEMVNPLEQEFLRKFRAHQQAMMHKAEQQAMKAAAMNNANQIWMESVEAQAPSGFLSSPQFPQSSPPQLRMPNQPEMSTRQVSTGSNGSSQMSPRNRPVNMIRRPSHGNRTPPQMNCQRTSSNASLINKPGGVGSPLRNSINSPDGNWGTMPQRALKYENNTGNRKGSIVRRPSMNGATPPQNSLGDPTAGRATTPVSSPGISSRQAGNGMRPSQQNGGPFQAWNSFKQTHGNRARSMSQVSFTPKTPPRIATPVFGQSASAQSPGGFPNGMRPELPIAASHPGQSNFDGQLDPALVQDTSDIVGWVPDAQRASMNLQLAQQARNTAVNIRFTSQAEYNQYLRMMHQKAAMARGVPQNAVMNNQQVANPLQASLHPSNVPVSSNDNLPSPGFNDNLQKVQAIYAAQAAQAQMNLAKNQEMAKSPQQPRSLFSPGHSIAAEPESHFSSFGSPLPSNATPDDNVFPSENLSNNLEDFLAKCGASNSNQSGGTNIAGQPSIDFSGITAQDSQPTRSPNLISMSRIPRSVQVSNPGLGISMPPKHPSKPPPDVTNWQQVSAPPAPNLIGNSMSGYDVGQFPPGFFNEDPPSRQSMMDMLYASDGGVSNDGGMADVLNDGDASEQWQAIIEEGLEGQETPKRVLDAMLEEQESPLKRKSSSTNLAANKKAKVAATAASGSEVDGGDVDELVAGENEKTTGQRHRQPAKIGGPAKKNSGTAPKVKSAEKTGTKKATPGQRGPGRPKSTDREGAGRGRGGAAARGGRGGVNAGRGGRSGSASASGSRSGSRNGSVSGGRSRSVSTEKESATGYTGTANLAAARARGGGGRK